MRTPFRFQRPHCEPGLRAFRAVLVVPNGLDEQLWSHHSPAPRWHPGGMNIVYMGTATHGPDLAIVLPAIERLLAEFGMRVRFDIVGVTGDGDLPEWANRLTVPASAAFSYPGFVDWFTRQADWDIGIAPLADTPFNRCKSAIKTMDYAALGLATVASDMPEFRGSIADGAGGFLTPNTSAAWYEALSRMLRNPRLRQTLSEGARTEWLAHYTLAAQAAARRRRWEGLARTAFKTAE